MMEARTKGSGWEITSTLNAQEKKKKKKNDEELKIACAEITFKSVPLNKFSFSKISKSETTIS